MLRLPSMPLKRLARPLLFAFPLGLVVLALQAAPHIPQARAQNNNDIDWKQGKWGALSSYIGTYRYEDLLKDPNVDKALTALLGDKKSDILAMLSVYSPIGFENDCLILEGNPERAADTQSVLLNICLYKGVVHAGVHKGGSVTLYSGVEKYNYLPPNMRSWAALTSAKISTDTKPDTVQMVIVAPSSDTPAEKTNDKKAP